MAGWPARDGLRAELVEHFRVLVGLYGHLGPSTFWAPMIAALEAHEPVVLADWQVSGRAGVPAGYRSPSGLGRLDPDDRVTAPRDSGSDRAPEFPSIQGGTPNPAGAGHLRLVNSG